MADQDEAKVAASIEFTHHEQTFRQSGLFVEDCVLTSGGIPYSLVLSHGVESIFDFSIRVVTERGDKRVHQRGFIADIFYSEHVANALVGCNYTKQEEHAYFLIIKIDPKSKHLRIKFINQKLYKGQDILTVGTPFGNETLLNSFCKGIISNVLNETLFLIDSRVSHGCEGGPVYLTTGNKSMIGMILFPVIENNENTGYSVCCTLYSICTSYGMLQKIATESKISFATVHKVLQSTPSLTRTQIFPCDAVLSIETSSHRGSCVVINEHGLLVTCSHNINYDVNTIVNVNHGGKQYAAEVLACSSQDDILDIAFLRIGPSDQLQTCTWAEEPPVKGNTVYTIGFRPINNCFIQLMSKGTVMIHEDYGPVYISCNTSFGNSGGGIFNDDGRLLGIVCAFIHEPKKRGPYSFGAGIPIQMMAKDLQNFIKSNDNIYLHRLCKTKDLSMAKWRLFIQHL